MLGAITASAFGSWARQLKEIQLSVLRGTWTGTPLAPICILGHRPATGDRYKHIYVVFYIIYLYKMGFYINLFTYRLHVKAWMSWPSGWIT